MADTSSGPVRQRVVVVPPDTELQRVEAPPPVPPKPIAATAAAVPNASPRELTRRRLAAFWKWAGIALAVLAFALALPRVGGFLADWWVAGRGVPPVVYALAHVVPTEECYRVSPDEIRNGTVAGMVSLRNVRASLHHHLRYGTDATGPLHGIAAQYLDRHRICMALVNMVYSPDDPETLVEMFNLRVTGGSKSRIVMNTERSVLCAEPYRTRRFQEIIIEYFTADGVRMEREVKGIAAQTIQQLDDVQSGRGYCKDNNLEAQMQKLHERLSEIEAARRGGPVTTTPLSLPAIGDGRRA